MLKSNVATFPSMLKSDVAMLRRGVQNRVCQRRDVGIQRRDVTEAWDFGFFERRDVVFQRRDVIKRVKFINFEKCSKYEKTP